MATKDVWGDCNSGSPSVIHNCAGANALVDDIFQGVTKGNNALADDDILWGVAKTGWSKYNLCNINWECKSSSPKLS